MSDAAVEHPASIDDLSPLPDDRVATEARVRGSFRPPPDRGHGRLTARVTSPVESLVHCLSPGGVDTGDGGFVLARSADTRQVLHAAFLSRERLEAPGGIEAFISRPPDLAVEVLSPGDTLGGMRAHVADDLAASPPIVRLADPERRTVAVYRELRVRPYARHHAVPEATGVVPGFEVRVGKPFDL